MAESTPQDDILPLGKLKQLLGLAEKEKLSCALALTKDKKDVLLLIDKVAKPKKVATLLKKEAAGKFEGTAIRFGRVSIDAKNDPGTVRFDVNKSEAGGTIPHMVKLVKKAGYQGCVFNEVATLEQESEEDGDSQATSVPPPPPPPSQAEPPIDAAALKARLTALVQRIPAVLAADPSRKDSLLAIAKQAQVMLGTNNLKSAAQSTDELEKALGKAPVGGAAPQTPPAANGAKPAGAVTYAKSRLAWLAARQKIGGEIAKLRAQLVAEYKGEPDETEILDAYDTGVAPILAAFDEDLADKLDDATNAEDAAKRQQLIADARACIVKYQKYLDGEKMIADLDSNPFVPLTIRATLSATLSALSAAIH